MFEKIKLIFKTNKMCVTLSKIVEIIISTKVVLNGVKEKVEGTPTGKKILPYINTVLESIDSIDGALLFMQKIVCVGAPAAPITTLSTDFNAAFANLKKSTSDLNNIVK